MTVNDKIVWSKQFELGVPKIDFEHQIFADLINGLADKIASGKDVMSISRTLREIIKYADFHFVSEENIMEECGYPGFKEHASLHRSLQQTLNEKAIAVASDEMSVAELLHFLVQWFVGHTQTEDLRIALYVQPN